MNSAIGLGIDKVEGGVDFLEDVVDTVERLNARRSRCQAMTSKLFREICLNAWDAEVAYENTRLTAKLSILVGDDIARKFIDLMLACIGF